MCESPFVSLCLEAGRSKGALLGVCSSKKGTRWGFLVPWSFGLVVRPLAETIFYKVGSTSMRPGLSWILALKTLGG